MPVFPLDVVPVVKTGNYPHMAKLDKAIYERFLDQYGTNFLGASYDVALGGFLPGEEDGTEELRRGWQYSTALKVDVVLFREDEVWICEIKPGGGTAGIGAALCYTRLAERDRFTVLPLVPVLITDRASPDIQLCARELGVELFAIDEPIDTEREEPDDEGDLEPEP